MTTVRTIPFGRPWITEEDQQAVLTVLQSPVLTHGPHGQQFEAEFAQFLGEDCYCIAVSSCMAALHLAYLQMGIGPGDEVIVPAQTHVATVHAVVMLAEEKWLHRGVMPPFLRALPPLMEMEALLFRILLAAFVLLTLTMVTGIFFSEQLFGRPLTFTHKTVFGILSWLIFGTLLAGHYLWGWRGRKAVHWTLAGFTALLLAYVGSKFVLEIILQR